MPLRFPTAKDIACFFEPEEALKLKADVTSLLAKPASGLGRFGYTEAEREEMKREASDLLVKAAPGAVLVGGLVVTALFVGALLLAPILLPSPPPPTAPPPPTPVPIPIPAS